MLAMDGQHWNLVADIGGTNARFAVADPASAQLLHVRHYRVAAFATFADGVQRFLDDVALVPGFQARPRGACLALACPIDGETIRLTNSHWQVDRAEVSALLDGAPVTLVNDFEAQGYGVIGLGPDDWREISPGVGHSRSPLVVVGPGTGLGVCTLVPVAGGFQVLAGEGGHVDFAPVDEVDIAILRHLGNRFGRVSAERVLSGAGLENVYGALADLRGGQRVLADAADIIAAAVAGSDALAVETLQIFCRALGSCAGNLALTLGARGGVYIAGGIVPRFLDFFLASGFRERFHAKGRFRQYLADVPVRLVTRADTGLAGAATRLTLTET